MTALFPVIGKVICSQAPATVRSQPWWNDQGLEMAKHKSFAVATKVQVYFCDPQSPWQRGTHENTNRQLRQYFPNNNDLSSYSQADPDKVVLRLNQRPRKTLGFETPVGKRFLCTHAYR
jgi:IS30 family transposase